MGDDVRDWTWDLLGRLALAGLLIIAILLAPSLLGGCAATSGPQGHTTFTTILAALTAAVVAFVTAPFDFLVAIGLSMATAFALLAFSPKYPLNPPRTPDGHEVHDHAPLKTPIWDKTIWEVIHG